MQLQLIILSKIIKTYNQQDSEFICPHIDNIKIDDRVDNKCDGICYKYVILFENSEKMTRQACLEYSQSQLEEFRNNLPKLQPHAYAMYDGQCTHSRCIPNLKQFYQNNKLYDAGYLPESNNDMNIIDPSDSSSLSNNKIDKLFTLNNNKLNTSHNPNYDIKKHRINKIYQTNKLDKSKTNSLLNLQNTKLNCVWNLKTNDYDCSQESLDDKDHSHAAELKEQLMFDDLIEHKKYIIKKFGMDQYNDIMNNISESEKKCVKKYKDTSHKFCKSEKGGTISMQANNGSKVMFKKNIKDDIQIKKQLQRNEK